MGARLLGADGAGFLDGPDAPAGVAAKVVNVRGAANVLKKNGRFGAVRADVGRHASMTSMEAFRSLG